MKTTTCDRCGAGIIVDDELETVTAVWHNMQMTVHMYNGDLCRQCRRDLLATLHDFVDEGVQDDEPMLNESSSEEFAKRIESFELRRSSKT